MSDWFNAKEETATLNDNSIIPAGLYNVVVSGMELKVDKFKHDYINLEMTISDGPLKNRKFWENLYLVSTEDWIQNKGRAIMKALCDATGIEKLGGPSDLVKFIGKEAVLKLGVYKNKDTHVERNIVNGITAAMKTTPAKATPAKTVVTAETEDDVPF